MIFIRNKSQNIFGWFFTLLKKGKDQISHRHDPAGDDYRHRRDGRLDSAFDGLGDVFNLWAGYLG